MSCTGEMKRLCMCMQLIRSLASLLLTLAVAQAQGVSSWFGSRSLWHLLAARGFIGAASMTLYYEGIARMPLADAVGYILQKLQSRACNRLI